MSLTSDKFRTENVFMNIILQSDHVNAGLVSWLKEVLAINGTIVQIYSDKKSLEKFADTNYELYIKYLSPTFKILNYCFHKTKYGMSMVSSNTLLIKAKETDNIMINNFGFTRSNLKNPNINFMNYLCLESDYGDSGNAYSFLDKISRIKHPFSYLINIRALPYFANLCKWTSSLSNCQNRSTLIINDRSELRLCWYGSLTGIVGDTYDEIINNLESEKNNVLDRRKCRKCDVSNKCIKCPSPFPLTDNEYCSNKVSTDVTHVADLIAGLDQIKQVLRS